MEKVNTAVIRKQSFINFHSTVSYIATLRILTAIKPLILLCAASQVRADVLLFTSKLVRVASSEAQKAALYVSTDPCQTSAVLETPSFPLELN